MRDRYAEGRASFDELADLPGGQLPTPARAAALTIVGQLAYCHCRFDVSDAYLREALPILAAQNDEAGAALASNVLGNVASGRGDLALVVPA